MSIVGSVAGFAAVAGLMTIVPGLDTLFVLRTAVARGRAPAFAAAFGILSGCLVWGAAAAVGATALLTASRDLYTAVRIAGAAYLIYPGISLLRTKADPDAGNDLAPAAGALWRVFANGFLVNLLNPKIGVFYLALIPQFLPANAPHVAMGLLLAMVHDAEGMLWFTAIIMAADRARNILSRSSVRRGIDRFTGSLLLFFGARIALSGNG
ncbi:LysE family translocator [Mycobacterium sp. CBMA226]|nr:LysE family translocator [Mycolicibacterium sp. CBMA 226]